MTLAKQMSSRTSRDAGANQETTGDGGKEFVEVESGEVTPNISLDSFLEEIFLSQT